MTSKQLMNYALLMESAANYVVEHKNAPFTTPDKVAEFMYPITKDLEQEHIWVLTLDCKNRLKSLCDITTGSINSTIGHPREIYKQAVLDSAVSIIVIHNHPSGDPAPSKQDIELTKQLIEAGIIIGIKCFDHIVLGKNIEGQFSSYYSIRRELNLDFE